MGFPLTRDMYAPSAYLARGIENLLIYAKNDENTITHTTICIVSRILGGIVFPTVLATELICEPFFLAKDWAVMTWTGNRESEGKLESGLTRISKLTLGIIFFSLSFIVSDAISYLFLHKIESDARVSPFGVEEVFGERCEEHVKNPSTIEELKQIVTQAKKNGQKISVIGAGMSQGLQTVPIKLTDVTIRMKNFNDVTFVPGSENSLVKIGAGATWEEVLLTINQGKKSTLVKQASDIFSIGGSIGINAHGWQHALGSIASTVTELEIIDANGEHKILTPNDELFGCMFGTLGYFGIVVSATLRLEDNVELEEKAELCSIENFHDTYQTRIRNNPEIPLLMGRLNVNRNPLTSLYINTFEKTDNTTPLITEGFSLESARGSRIARVFLAMTSHLPKILYTRLMDFYWDREVDIMTNGHKIDSRNNILHFPLKSFFQLHQSNLYTQWLQEYFVLPENLPNFLKFLSETLEAYDVSLLNASIRPTPKDTISILPYAEEDRYAIVISFNQEKTQKGMKKTQEWIEKVQTELLATEGKWYQAYMPYATEHQFAECYGEENLKKVITLKNKYDPKNLFSNRHTVKYFDRNRHLLSTDVNNKLLEEINFT